MTTTDRNDVCEWAGPDVPLKGCRAPALYTVDYGGRLHPLCEKHADPDVHPRDLRQRIRPIGEFVRTEWKP